MKRRHLLLSALAALASPLLKGDTATAEPTMPAIPQTDNVPLTEVTYSTGSVGAYLTDDEAIELDRVIEELKGSDPMTVRRSAFIPTGQYMLWLLECCDELATFTSPFDVPESFGKYGQNVCVAVNPGELLTKEEAIQKMVANNRRMLGRKERDCWFLIAELGKRQGDRIVTLTCSYDEYSIVSQDEYCPARIYRHREVAS